MKSNFHLTSTLRFLVGVCLFSSSVISAGASYFLGDRELDHWVSSIGTGGGAARMFILLGAGCGLLYAGLPLVFAFRRGYTADKICIVLVAGIYVAALVGITLFLARAGHRLFIIPMLLSLPFLAFGIRVPR